MGGAAWTIAAAVAASGMVALGATAWVARRRARVLDAVEAGIAALGARRPSRPARDDAVGAAGRLARRFNQVAPELESRIERLEEERHQLQAVLSGMAEGVVAVDSRRRLVFANPAAERLFGLGPDANGRLVAELIRVPPVQDAVAATLAGGEPYRGEVVVPGRGLAAANPALALAVQGTPLPGSPPSGAVLVFHDVTELRRLERMRQDFVANASHELKTPLASIKAYTETLLDWALHDDEVNGRFLGLIDEQVDRLNALIHDMLSLSKLESGQEPYRHEPTALAPVVRRCVEGQRDRAEAKGLALGLAIDRLEDDVLVRADAEALRQILDNLIDNAIKYTAAGGSVEVGARLDGDEVVLSVADTGVGIPRDDLPRIFERFYRVDKARSREIGGTGLGLSIVKHLVQSLGGQVQVESRSGLGSTFIVRLARVDPAAGG